MSRLSPLAFLLALLALAACGGGSGNDDAVEPSNGGDATPAGSETQNGGGPGDDAGAALISFTDHLSVGDCFADQFDDEGEYTYIAPPPFQDCEGVHGNEVFHVVEYDPGPRYPGDDAFVDFTDEECDDAFYEFLGVDETAYYWYALWPFEEEWEAGDRTVACVLYLEDAQMRGSAAGKGARAAPAEMPGNAPIPVGAFFLRVGDIDGGAPAPPAVVLEESGVGSGNLTYVAFVYDGSLDEAKSALLDEAEATGWEVTWERDEGGTAFYRLDRDGTWFLAAVIDLEDPSIGYYFEQ